MSEESTSFQVLTFRLQSERFGVPISRVQEVNELGNVTRIPRSDPSIRGLLNLRGLVIPVVDLRSMLGFSATEDTIDTCVIVAEVQKGEERTLIGALADAVDEVTEIDRSTLVPPPTLGTQVPADFIQGLARREDGLLMILDLDRLSNSTAAAE